MATITGVEAHVSRMRALPGETTKTLGKVIYVISDMVRTYAVNSITEGAISGKGHIPSRPGQPPNADTHLLDSNIINEMTGPLTAQVVSRAPYAIPLEAGTSKMAARPYMRPAGREGRRIAPGLIAKAVEKLLTSRGF